LKNILIISLLIFFLTSCSNTRARHVGTPSIDANGNEYSIKPNESGFFVVGHYSEHQFVRNSRDGFIGCTDVLNKAAREYADSHKLTIEYPTWNEVTIINHSRNIISAIMHVNCQFEYKKDNELTSNKPKQSTKSSITNQLTELSDLYEKGLLSKEEFNKAKTKLLSE
jgi:hypothetical protein